MRRSSISRVVRVDTGCSSRRYGRPQVYRVPSVLANPAREGPGPRQRPCSGVRQPIRPSTQLVHTTRGVTRPSQSVSRTWFPLSRGSSRRKAADPVFRTTHPVFRRIDTMTTRRAVFAALAVAVLLTGTAAAQVHRHEVGAGQRRLAGQRQQPAHRLLRAAVLLQAESRREREQQPHVELQGRRRVRHHAGPLELRAVEPVVPRRAVHLQPHLLPALPEGHRPVPLGPGDGVPGPGRPAGADLRAAAVPDERQLPVLQGQLAGRSSRVPRGRRLRAHPDEDRRQPHRRPESVLEQRDRPGHRGDAVQLAGAVEVHGRRDVDLRPGQLHGEAAHPRRRPSTTRSPRRSVRT